MRGINNFGDAATLNPRFIKLVSELQARNKRTRRRRALKKRKEAYENGDSKRS